MSTDQLFDLYHSTMSGALDAFLPVRSVTTRFQPSAPWFDDECRAIKRRVRMLERRYRLTRKDVDRLSWIEAARSKHRQFRERENLYWEACIASNTGNPRKLWRSISSLLGDPAASRSGILPSFSPADYLRFMEDKLDSVRAATEGAPAPSFETTECLLSSFEFCTEEDIRKIIGASPSKSCDLDPVPTFLVKDYLDTLLPFITRLCNASIREACLPATQKKAIITPVIKKVGADVDDVKNYRPISGLTFLSKVIEKVVAKQLVGYLHSNNLLPKFQSGFRRGYSTETAILRMLSDIYAAVDRGRVALLALLDVSAAFDTVDHDILLERLLVSFGVTGSAHAWIRSFLSSRSQSVRLGSSSSSWSSIRCGVPQGSILGPLLYILYTADVERIVESFGSLCSCTPTILNSMVMVHLSPRRSSQLAFWLLSTPLRTGCRQIAYGWMPPRRSSSGLARGNNCQTRLDVVGLHLSSIGFQRSSPKSGCSSGQWAHQGCSHQTTVPVMFLPATKVARGPKLSVEKIFADSYIRFRSQQAGLLQQHPVRGHGWEVGSTTVRSQRHSATGPQPSEVLANHIGHPRWATLAPCCVRSQYKLCIIVRNCFIGSAPCICGNYALRLPPSQVVSISDLLPETTS